MKILEKLRPSKNDKKNNNDDTTKKDELSNLDQFLDTSSLDEIYPFSWEEQPTHIESGSNFIRVFTIVDYPKKKRGNWLGELKRKKGNITVTQYLEAANSDNMVRFYNDTIKNKETELLNTLDPIQEKKIKREIEVANFQLDKYLSSESSYIYQYTYVFMQARSIEELEDLSSSVTKTLTKLQLKALTPTKGMYQAFWSALPLGENLLKEYTYKESNTEAASSFFPFDDAEICDLNPHSQVEGVNKDTNSLVAVNYLNTARTLNQNMVVIGKSGVGKSTYMVQKILRNFAKGIKQFIIDPENEYSRIVELLGGEVMHLSSNANTKINPLEIFSSEIDDDDIIKKDMEVLVKDKIQRVKGFFQVIKPDITQVEKALLDTILRNCYINCGILKYDDIKEISSEQYPILTSVFEEVEKLRDKDPERFAILKDFYYILESYCFGSNSLFNGHTNIDMTKHLVSFDLKPLQNEPDVQAAAYLNTFSYLWDEITKNRSELIYLYIDEFHFLAKNPDSMKFFYQAYKRFRKYNAGAIAGTQQIVDVLEAADNLGAAIIENSHTKVFFGLGNKGVDDLVQKLKMNFSDKERKLLGGDKQGEALFVYGSNRAFMKVQLTQEELRLWNPKRYEEEYGVSADIVPDYEEMIKMTPQETEEAASFQY